MRYIILLVVLFSCAEERLTDCSFLCFKMQISDSVPIQFWVNGETFNQVDVCGIQGNCFCLPSNCTDEITIQATDASGNEFDLVLYDTDNVEISRIPFTEVASGVFQVTFIPSELSPGLCEKISFKIESEQYHVLTDQSFDDTDQAFTTRTGLGNFWGVSPNGEGWTQTTDKSFGGFAIPNGCWFYDGSDMEGNLSMNQASADSDGETLSQSFEPITGEFTINMAGTYTFSYNNSVQILLTIELKSLGVVVATQVITINSDGASPDAGNVNNLFNLGTFTDVDEVTIRLTSSGTSTLGTFSLSLTEFDLYAENYVSKESDCIDMRNNHQCTKLISYTNSDDFDGINYNISPQPTFYLRVPAQLLPEENPQTQEDLELSNGVIVTIRQTIQEKYIFKLGYMTAYMHTKVQKILMHDTVIIDGIQWKKRDAYDAPRIEDYPLKKGEVLLTKYNSVLKNTI